MNSSPPLTVKIATEGWEFEQIHALNHQTFAEEIPQHPANDTARLVDRFHGENTYVAGLSGRRLVGMIAIRDRRPFSLDQRMPDLDTYLPPGRSICELRLLAVEKGQRASRVLPALLDFVWRHCLARGYDLALISAVTTQLKLYRHMGFEPFGPLTGSPGAQFQPMLLTLERFAVRAPRAFRRPPPLHVASFLPGPVAIDDAVASALQRPPVSHRSPGFVTLLESVKTALCRLVDAERVELFLGNGTMANDVIAGQLTLERAPGVVLINGEFGLRLQDHANRAGLTFDTVEMPWGAPFETAAVASCLARSSARWLWFAHCETSTGVLNDLEAMRSICASAGVRLCVDAISSVGTTPVSLRGVYLASCVSGKGLASFPGISMVFYDHDLQSCSTGLPRSLDLGLYAREGGVPFTHSSNLLRALDAALHQVDWQARFRTLGETSDWMRRRLLESGFDIVGSAGEASPGVVSVAIPAHLNSVGVAIELEKQGYLVSANSRYLVERNWIQICAMGNVSRDELSAVLTALEATCDDRVVTAL